MPLQCFNCSDSFPFLELWCCCWESGKSLRGGLMGRPLSLRIGGSRAALGSRPPGGLAGEPGARMAVGVGVVVSAFRFTPFFCREKQDGSLLLQVYFIQAFLPHYPKRIHRSVPWQGAGLGELLKQQGAGVQQSARTWEGEKRWLMDGECWGQW